ncbi:MAG: nucleotidyltransferase domain-containing protein, partial [Bacteroidota bacterium]|nr:nucleotidyltransferase domain-containing protein [Bacteroidota bacterium]
MNSLPVEYSDFGRSFLRKLIYFDVFSHPLLAEEIVEYCDLPGIDKTEGMNVLEALKARKLINCESGFYFIGDDYAKVARRMEGNKLASLRMNDARKNASIAANFPFVRAVFISGTLSKHVMKPESDIDFFIVTEPGKLWLCRALLTLYKKLVLGGSHRNFCLNYFIDSNNLEIPDKNIFTATELVTLLPMYNYPLYKSFMIRNNWVSAEFPNFKFRPEEYDIRPGTTKKVLEYILNNPLGNFLDRLSFSIILGFWKRKFRHLSEKSFSLNFRSQKNVSKHHPNAFQQKVVNKYYEKTIA